MALTSMSTATLEQPIAQQREIARLFVKKIPVPPGGSSREEKEAWGSWVWFVRKFAERDGIKKVGVPCRAEAAVRVYEGTNRRIAVDYATARWYWAIGDALTRSIIPDAGLLRDLVVRYEPVPPETPLDERPNLEGTEIIIYEEGGDFGRRTDG